jgi:O-antigen ligase
VLAAAVPLLFLHARYTPGITVSLGSTEVAIKLTDLAIAAVVVTGSVAWRRLGIGRVATAHGVWAAAAALLALALASVAWGPLVTTGYPVATNAVSALKFVEYALLAPAAALLLRTRRDVLVLATSVTVWTTFATAVAVLQFVGVLGDLDDTPAGRRKPSFVGYHDFAALAAATLLLGVVLLMLNGGDRRVRLVGRVAAGAGGLGVALAGSIAAAAGAVAATAAVLFLLRTAGGLDTGRALRAAAVVAVAIAGTVAIRSGDVADFARFLGIERHDAASNVETYSHRTVLSYIGVRIAADHPWAGTGWQGSALPESFMPYLADARARFPSVSEEALPSPNHRWGVQNAYIQAAADMGIAGAIALLALLIGTVAVAYRRARRRVATAPLLALAWLLVSSAELAALGLVSGVPVWALAWLAVGLAVASPVVGEGDA